ncbi:hypothetical protein AB0H43_26820 [Hamadaea sp. NPDC050747]|uniref:hypothetical protein n=1 Tax=Hamadaea sp. NPDC050747 TaxID=3155789 RepID=UPI0033CC8B38
MQPRTADGRRPVQGPSGRRAEERHRTFGNLRDGAEDAFGTVMPRDGSVVIVGDRQQVGGDDQVVLGGLTARHRHLPRSGKGKASVEAPYAGWAAKV